MHRDGAGKKKTEFAEPMGGLVGGEGQGEAEEEMMSVQSSSQRGRGRRRAS